MKTGTLNTTLVWYNDDVRACDWTTDVEHCELLAGERVVWVDEETDPDEFPSNDVVELIMMLDGNEGWFYMDSSGYVLDMPIPEQYVDTSEVSFVLPARVLDLRQRLIAMMVDDEQLGLSAGAAEVLEMGNAASAKDCVAILLECGFDVDGAWELVTDILLFV